MHPDLKALLHDEVLIAPYTGTDNYGKPSHGPAVAYLASVERRYLTQATTTGPVTVEQTIAFLDETAIIDTRSQVTLPGGRVVPIQGLKPVNDERGRLDHWQLYF